MLPQPQFVLPDFTLFSCGRHGSLLSDYLPHVSQKVSGPFDVFSARVQSSEALTKLSEGDDLDHYLPRRFLVRSTSSPSSQAIRFRAGGQEVLLAPQKPLNDFLQKRAPPAGGLRCGASLLGLDLDPALPAGDTGLATGDVVAVTTRKPLKVAVAGQPAREVLLPLGITSPAALCDFLGQPPPSHATHDGRRYSTQMEGQRSRYST